MSLCQHPSLREDCPGSQSQAGWPGIDLPSGAPLAVHGDDWLGFHSSWAVLLPSLFALLPSQLLVFHVFVVLGTVVFCNSAGWHYVVLCCEKSNTVFAPSQASGFSQDSVFPATANDIVFCIIARGSFTRTHFKPLHHLACMTGIGSGRHRCLNRIHVW